MTILDRERWNRGGCKSSRYTKVYSYWSELDLCVNWANRSSITEGENEPGREHLIPKYFLVLPNILNSLEIWTDKVLDSSPEIDEIQSHWLSVLFLNCLKSAGIWGRLLDCIKNVATYFACKFLVKTLSVLTLNISEEEQKNLLCHALCEILEMTCSDQSESYCLATWQRGNPVEDTANISESSAESSHQEEQTCKIFCVIWVRNTLCFLYKMYFSRYRII